MFAALISAGGAPGTSTTALGLALNPTTRALLVEADPAGSSDVLAGYLHGEQRHSSGLIDVVAGHRENRIVEGLNSALLEIPGSRTALLPALHSAAQAAGAAPVWSPLGTELAALETQGWDVVVDCGRITAAHAPLPLLAQADVVAVVTGTTLSAVNKTRASLGMLQSYLNDTGAPASLGLILIEDGHYSPRDLSGVLGIDVISTVPHSAAAAAVYSQGRPGRRRDAAARSSYQRSLSGTWEQLRRFTSQHRPSWIEQAPVPEDHYLEPRR